MQEFIHDATFEEDIDNAGIQFNTYIKENSISMEGKPTIPIVHTDIATGVGHLTSPTYSDQPNPNFSVPMQTQPIQTQLFQSTGVRLKPTNPFYQQPQTYQTPLTQEEIRTHQIPNNDQQRISPINYSPRLDHQNRVLASTPTEMAPPINTIPPPPGFAYFPHE